MRTRTLRFWDSLRSSYWFLPAAMMVAAVGLALVTTRVDQRFREPWSSARWLDWIWGGGADGAREVLAIIAGTAINVAGVTFSITIVALTLASSQFGPRMLRNFMRDTGIRWCSGPSSPPTSTACWRCGPSRGRRTAISSRISPCSSAWCWDWSACAC